MTDDVTTDLPARPRAAERYTEGMNRWFQESLQNNRPWVDTLVAAGIAQAFADGSPHLHGLLSAIGKVYADERRQRQKEIEGLRKEVAALEQRLLERPGKLPVAKTWKPETVFYANEVVTHDGALWQARKDTATRPGGADWVCVARAGRDAITPNVCGTFSADETYRQLDIVMHDGAAWIARCDDPGICPGDGWQLMSKQGRRGRPGDRGPPGDRGDLSASDQQFENSSNECGGGDLPLARRGPRRVRGCDRRETRRPVHDEEPHARG
jgi:hypothetical protein